MADDVSTMAGGQRIVDTALAQFGRIDGVVCVAGILRERMLFNMSEEEWDPVVATHLKGTFTVFRAASAVMRRQGSGTLLGFTSGNHQGSVSQANYASAKGGIISLVRSAALGLHKYGVTANAVAPVARTRMSANVPMELKEIGEPEDVAALVVYLLSEQAREGSPGRCTRWPGRRSRSGPSRGSCARCMPTGAAGRRSRWRSCCPGRWGPIRCRCWRSWRRCAAAAAAKERPNP